MDDTEKNKIFDRMFEISLKVDPGHIPSPRTINENLGQCHIYLEEINKAYIKVIKEMSILQRHLNNRQTDFEIKLDSFISTNDEIIALPSSRDREAKAKTMLKSEIVEIKQLENEIEDLEKLIKVISMRHKDMARANMDIRIQSRLMESEIKLNGMSSPSDNASKDLLQDNHIWDGAITEVKELNTIDPTDSNAIDDLISTTIDNETLLATSEDPKDVIKKQPSPVLVEEINDSENTEEIDEPDIISEASQFNTNLTPEEETNLKKFSQDMIKGAPVFFDVEDSKLEINPLEKEFVQMDKASTEDTEDFLKEMKPWNEASTKSLINVEQSLSEIEVKTEELPKSENAFLDDLLKQFN